MNLKIYGCRGSISFSHRPYSVYGGNTTCMRLESGGNFLILDAGTGILQYEADLRTIYPSFPYDLPQTDILLSHLHLDHITGLATFKPVWVPGGGVRIFTRSRDKRSLKKQVFDVFKPPYWSVEMELAVSAEVVEISNDTSYVLGNVFTVTPFAASHPDDTTSFCVTDGNKKLVYLLDYEIGVLNDEDFNLLATYCRDVDAVIFDATYHLADYAEKRGWGHSTVEDGKRLAEASNCKKMIFAHFSQDYDDKTLDEIFLSIDNTENRYLFARDGMDLIL